jgi:hypothetical protein
LCLAAESAAGNHIERHLGKDHHLMRIALRSSLLSLTFLAALSTPANALEIFGNTGLGNSGLQFVVDYDRLAQGFTIPAFTTYTLSSVDIGLRINSPAPTSSQMLISLYSNGAGNNPGTLIGSFDTANPTPAYTLNDNGVYRFNYTGAQTTLSGSTSYWIVIESTATSPVFRWFYAENGATDTPVVQNASGVSYFGTRLEVAESGTWTNGAAFSGLRYTVNVVPEPSTYALGLVGTLVMGTVARRKGRKTASA